MPTAWIRDRNSQLAQVSAQLSLKLYFSGVLDEALVVAERALQIAEMVDVPEAFVVALNARASVLAARGRRDEAELVFDGASRFAIDRNVGAEQRRTLEVNLGSTLEEADKLDACLEHYEQSEALARRLGDRVGVATSRLTQSTALLELGRWDEYAAICGEYLDHDAPELAVPVVSRLLGSGIWLHLWRGDRGRCAQRARHRIGARRRRQHRAGGHARCRAMPQSRRRKGVRWTR